MASSCGRGLRYLAGCVAASVAAALGYGAVMWVAHEMRPSGLGFGDVKLSPLLGLNIGWAAATFHRGGWAVVGLVAQALLLSCVIGLATGLVLGLRRRTGRSPGPDAGASASATGERLLHTAFPFGPALAAGTMVAVLFSEALLA